MNFHHDAPEHHDEIMCHDLELRLLNDFFVANSCSQRQSSLTIISPNQQAFVCFWSKSILTNGSNY